MSVCGSRKPRRSRSWSSAGSWALIATSAGAIRDRRLSDMTLRWMQDKASALGLALRPGDGRRAELSRRVHRLLRAVSRRRLCKKKSAALSRHRSAAKFGNEIIDESVQRRRKEDRDYEPQNNGLPALR